MKTVCISLLIGSLILIAFQSHRIHSVSPLQQENDDTLIWEVAELFSTSFNNGDAKTMNKLLPDDFMLQWLHENFLEKKGLLISMLDTSVHTTLKHRLNRDSKSLIRYSDNYKSASLNTSFEFIDPVMTEEVKKENCYGLCIMYFQKRKGRWHLQTVHLDLHCTLCNI